MNENRRNIQEPKSSLDETVKQLDKTDEVLRKKLVKKIYFIVFAMIVTLVTIIIVEFKELRFNSVVEYKIGKNDLGPKDLVWAGIMGTPPSYYESDKKYGLGIKEFETREIRVALEEAGFNIIYRYMSPNRLEFEFTRKHPLCFYDRKWSDPKEHFKQNRPEILSISLNYTGKEPKKIIFRKEDRSRFDKHLDEKGNLVLTSLIKDTSLKTELIRAINYDGPYHRGNITYGKKQSDGTYYDIVRDKFAKNIDLVILHTNDQILQMLGKKRFDYQFYDTLEYDDYVWLEGGQNRIGTIIYEDKKVNSVNDPNMVFHSVACGNHPLTKKAMPIINEVIYNTRLHEDKHNSKVKYAKKLNPLSTLQNFRYTGWNVMNVTKADFWYDFQFTSFKKNPWPLFPKKSDTLNREFKEDLLKIGKKDIPQWKIIQEEDAQGEKKVIIIHDTDLKNKAQEKILTMEFLEKVSSKKSSVILEEKKNFKDLNFSKIVNVNNLIIFAHGIKDEELGKLTIAYGSPSLKSLTLIDGSIQHSYKVQQCISHTVEVLRFFDVPLIGTPIGNTIRKLKNLKSFAIHAGSSVENRLFITNTEILSLIKSLPKTLEELSLLENQMTLQTIPWFPDEFSQEFAKKNFQNLKFLQLKNFSLGEKDLKLILDSTPLSLESLIIGSSMLYASVSSLIIEEFLNKRYAVNKLKLLRVSRMMFSVRKNNKLLLPKSLEDLSLTWAIGPIDTQFDRIIFHPEIQLKSLDLSSNNLTDFTVKKIFAYLNPKMENLILSKNRITGKLFLHSSLMNNHHLKKIKSITNLKMDSNPIDDQGFVYFSQLPWKIKKLDISNIKITDHSFEIFSSKKMPNLIGIDLSENYLSQKYITHFFRFHSHQLKEIKLRNILSIEMKDFSTYISKDLEVLDLSGNLLNDDQITLLVSKLPKNLRVLNISGSRMGVKGAMELAKHMPNLTQFYFDLKPSDQEMGLRYLLYNLSPFLIHLSKFGGVLSYVNAQILSMHMPSFLNEFFVPEFEKEECKILLSFLPNTLRYVDFRNDLKSKGNTLKILNENFPDHLFIINFGEKFTTKERDEFLRTVKNKKLDIRNSLNSNTEYTDIFLKYHSLYYFYLSGTFKNQNLNELIYTPFVIFQKILLTDRLNLLFSTIKPEQLRYLKYISLESTENIGVKELVYFLSKFPKNTQAVTLRSMGITLENVDKIINALPKNLRRLNISENLFGEVGLKKFREFKRKMEEKTGLPFELVEVTVLNQ